MEATNDMKRRRGRKKGSKAGAIARPHIGGMETLGPKPIHGLKASKTKKRAARK